MIKNWNLAKCEVQLYDLSPLRRAGQFHPRFGPDKYGLQAGAKKILQGLGFNVKGTTKEWRVTPPSKRATRDISIPEDIVEEVAQMLSLPIDLAPMRQIREQCPKDVPGDWFAGPF